MKDFIQVITALFIKTSKQIRANSKFPVPSLNAHTVHEIYVLIYLTAIKTECSCFECFQFYILTSLLDLDNKQNMQNLNEVVLVHYTEGVSVSVCKNHFYDKEIPAVFNFMCNVKYHGSTK